MTRGAFYLPVADRAILVQTSLRMSAAELRTRCGGMSSDELDRELMRISTKTVKDWVVFRGRFNDSPRLARELERLMPTRPHDS